MEITKKKIIEDLENLGIQKGDTLLLRAALSKIGLKKNKLSELLIPAFFDILGKSGTVIVPSFTKTYLFPFINKKNTFTENTKSYTGFLSHLFKNHVDSIRSSHPTNSFIGIGKNSKSILFKHNEFSSCFSIIKDIIQLNGKLINIGCIETSPGFSTAHYAQHNLKLSKKNIFSKKLGSYFYKNNQNKLFLREDCHGCSKGFGNFYPLYRQNNLLKEGSVGKAKSMIINADKAYQLEYKVLKQNPKFIICNHINCLSCRGSLTYNKIDWPKFYFTHFPSLVFNYFKKNLIS